MPEELAFGEVGSHRSAVEHDERTARAIALRMKRVSDDVLAGARLSQKRQRHLGTREPIDQFEDLLHGG
jgi:hypothetical protein